MAEDSKKRSHPSIIVVCTKDRPDETKMCCIAAHKASPDLPILIVDASTTDATRQICERISRRHGRSLELIHRRAREPGLARQRNEAVGLCRELGVELVHFIDDDTEVSPGYFDAIERRFRQDRAVMGVGGIIVNQPRVTFLAAKSLFLLGSRRRGSVLRSGRNMLGQYPGTPATQHVEWLNGCSMSYRIAVFDELMFDGRLEGPSLGEDYDFSFRLSREHRLSVEPSATCVHHLTPTARSSRRAHARQRTQIIHRRVSEHRDLGLSLTAFWWSTLGDFLLRGVYGALRFDAESLQEAHGVVDGVFAIIRKRAPSSQRESVASAAAGWANDT